MKHTWVLVADGARARLFEVRARNEPWNELACFTNPDGRAPGRDATTERAPRVNESANAARHAIEPHTTLREKSMERFAHIINDALERGLHDHRYHKLVLVAPPRFLGRLHNVLGKLLQDCVAGEIRHNFTSLRGEEIRARLPARMFA